MADKDDHAFLPIFIEVLGDLGYGNVNVQ